MFESWDVFLNSSFTTSFFGAIAGAITILSIEHFSRKRKLLADINACIGITISLMDTLLLIKKQHVVPLLKNYRENIEIKNRPYSQNLPKNYTLLLYKFPCPQLYADFPLERLFAVTHSYPQIIQTIIRVKRSCAEVERTTERWNSTIDKMMQLSHKERSNFYFGEGEDGVTNNYFANIVQTQENDVDYALLFSNETLKELTIIALKTLPKRLHKHIAKVAFESEDGILIPTLTPHDKFEMEKKSTPTCES